MAFSCGVQCQGSMSEQAECSRWTVTEVYGKRMHCQNVVELGRVVKVVKFEKAVKSGQMSY